ncbi:MAG: type II toxin-antitoxin system PemK/MazF family toxin [Alphaproteobacteria bacterium]|nr:MAG: type II toxin-antitoxin system PemK/MazF family toxin [Alphaproteobacteria bacterium]TAF76657.1 MAG: type II toxin-antitoxin system PemK/MazF family toxin [Alphaproteobacteria bacterium]
MQPIEPTPRRGEVWWVNFDPSIGGEIRKKRPAVIVSNNMVSPPHAACANPSRDQINPPQPRVQREQFLRSIPAS